VGEVSIRPDRDDVCWEPVRLDSGEGYWHDEDRWPHFKSRAECAETIAELVADWDEDEPLHLVARPCFDRPCVEIVCDGCGEEFSYDGDGGMHFDPSDPIPVPLDDCDWLDLGDRHYCPDFNCRPQECHDCGEHHEGICDADGGLPKLPLCIAPDGSVLDVPLFEAPS
jgi:hypothetical protein